jgi:anti-anti-sigma factor
VVVETDVAAAAATVRVCGEVDIATVAELRAGPEKVVAGRPGRLVVDLAATTFIDASGMNAIAWARRAAPPACEMVLHSPNRLARMVIGLTGMDRICRVEADKVMPGGRRVVAPPSRAQPEA